jgi:hypothetical protein
LRHSLTALVARVAATGRFLPGMQPTARRISGPELSAEWRTTHWWILRVLTLHSSASGQSRHAKTHRAPYDANCTVQIPSMVSTRKLSAQTLA